MTGATVAVGTGVLAPGGTGVNAGDIWTEDVTSTAIYTKNVFNKSIVYSP